MHTHALIEHACTDNPLQFQNRRNRRAHARRAAIVDSGLVSPEPELPPPPRLEAPPPPPSVAAARVGQTDDGKDDMLVEGEESGASSLSDWASATTVPSDSLSFDAPIRPFGSSSPAQLANSTFSTSPLSTTSSLILHASQPHMSPQMQTQAQMTPVPQAHTQTQAQGHTQLPIQVASHPPPPSIPLQSQASMSMTPFQAPASPATLSTAATATNTTTRASSLSSTTTTCMPSASTAPIVSLDQLLDLDNARQCLVFSPLDLLPRLDFDDLRLDVPTIENWLGLPSTPGVSSLHVPPISAGAMRSAKLALSQPLNAPDELMGRAADEGWSLSEQLTPLWNVPTDAHRLSDLSLRIDGTMLRRDSVMKAERMAPPPSAPLTTQSYPLPLSARWNHDAIAPNVLTWDLSRGISSTLVP